MDRRAPRPRQPVEEALVADVDPFDGGHEEVLTYLPPARHEPARPRKINRLWPRRGELVFTGGGWVTRGAGSAPPPGTVRKTRMSGAGARPRGGRGGGP